MLSRSFIVIASASLGMVTVKIQILDRNTLTAELPFACNDGKNDKLGNGRVR
jgi:hypothetical protein